MEGESIHSLLATFLMKRSVEICLYITPSSCLHSKSGETWIPIKCKQRLERFEDRKLVIEKNLICFQNEAILYLCFQLTKCTITFLFFPYKPPKQTENCFPSFPLIKLINNIGHHFIFFYFQFSILKVVLFPIFQLLVLVNNFLLRCY